MNYKIKVKKIKPFTKTVNYEMSKKTIEKIMEIENYQMLIDSKKNICWMMDEEIMNIDSIRDRVDFMNMVKTKGKENIKVTTRELKRYIELVVTY